MLLDMMRNRLPFAVFATVAVFTLAACGGDSTGIEDEPEVAVMRLTVGTATINVNAATGAVSGGPITIARNASVNVSAQFLRADGTPDPLVSGTAFQLSAESDNTGIVTFTRSGSFSGTLAGVGPGSTSIVFGLFHVGEGHNEFEWPVSVTVSF